MNTGTDAFENRVNAAIDAKTKPVGALGQIETLAAQVARVQNSLTPEIDTCDLYIFAGDHGIATSGVSAFPQTVTRQMVLNFLSGGAAANVFARSVGAAVHVVDAGIAGDPIIDERLLRRRQGAGTENSIHQSAMTAAQLNDALKAGQDIGEASQAHVFCCGEMGIGNTSSASLVSAKLIGCSVVELAGRGTGLDDAGLKRKAALLKQAAARTPSKLSGDDALAQYGGFEIAMMTGAMIGAAATGKIVIVDGYIATAAALCAVHLAPESRPAMVFAHHSAEAGHTKLLQALNADPLLLLNLRLGEGTGALLAFPLVKAAASMLREMASFEDAGVSGPA